MRILRPASFQRRVVLCGTGMFVPARVVTNGDLIAMGADFAPGEVERLTGIVRRRWVEPGVGTSDLAINACEGAMNAAVWTSESVDRVVVATVSPDFPTPSAACLVQHGLGLGSVPAHDVTASCSGFLYALDVAARCVLTGDDRVLAVAADVRSAFLHPSQRNTFALFADGAGAVAVGSQGIGPQLEAITLAADGSGARSVYVPMGGSREPPSTSGLQAHRNCIHMGDGAAVYFAAVDGMIEIAERLLTGCGLGWSDVDLLVPHQPNLRLLRRLAKVVGLSADRVHINLDRYGNVSGASCAIALHEVLQRTDLRPGARLLLLTAGAGYTAGAAIVRLPLETS